MSIQQLKPKEAKEAMDVADHPVYIDVRTEMEFAQGHPEGALNIPVTVPGPGGMAQNPQFVAIVEKIFPDKNQPIFCGCQMGGRSQIAAEFLVRAGYTRLVNVQGGFGGRVQNGVVIIPGWKDCGLPVETKVDDTNSYAGLKKLAGL